VRCAIAQLLALPLSLLAFSACDSGDQSSHPGPVQASPEECPGPGCPGCPGPTCGPTDPTPPKADGTQPQLANPVAGGLVLYELQARSANACHPDVGSSWQREACAEKVAPEVVYRAEGEVCDIVDELETIKLGTLDDLLEDTDDFRAGITVRYVDERVGANALWLMPVFPNNDQLDLPHPCDNLGSPYAVRDYWHVRGDLSRACIAEGADEESAEPCFGDDALEAVIDEAHRRGMKVMLDVAFNHFGHGYRMYDDLRAVQVRDRLDAGADLDALWDFTGTHDEALLYPRVFDGVGDLAALDGALADELAAFRDRCPSLEDGALVRGFTMWRNALDGERERFDCDAETLEQVLFGFYLGSDRWQPASGPGDGFTNNWRDVKFLFHQATNTAAAHEYARNREYLVRVMNYWVARGVDGFRLDHSTDFNNGLSTELWRYALAKVNHYAALRGQPRPIYLAEEFFTQDGMADHVDLLTEGYVTDMTARRGQTKNAQRVEWVLANAERFDGRAYVMTALETHDEHRLTDGTGFDPWVGAGFYSVGASAWSVPMLLMGQEFGEQHGLGFKRSTFVSSRFVGGDGHRDDADALVDFYGAVNGARRAYANRALISAPRHFLRTKDADAVDDRVFAQVKWSGDGNVVFVFQNLWRTDVRQAYHLPPHIADALWLRAGLDYHLVDVFTGAPVGDCVDGGALADDLYVEMAAEQRLQWLRLEVCD
jgi:hypothetical protein